MFKMTRTHDSYKTLEQKFPKLRECQVYCSYALYDNGVADKKTAQTVAAKLSPSNPVSHGGYTFTVEKL